MSATIHTDAARRHDFCLLFDVVDGNPNGDPDAGNLPRVDPQTMQGLVTDVALKRKVRDWIDVMCGDEARNKIYVQSGIVLNDQHLRAYNALGIEPKTGRKNRQPRADVAQTRQWMCANFYDIRMFGAVMAMDVDCGQVRGPMQLTFARSVDPIVPLDLSITRVAVTNERDAEKGSTMGRKALVPYGLYRAHGFFSPHLARQTGASDEDLALFWQALEGMWDLDRSAARGMMACRGLYVYSHANPLGNAPAHRLFERIAVTRKDGVTSPRAFADYRVEVDDASLPEGVTLTVLEG